MVGKVGGCYASVVDTPFTALPKPQVANMIPLVVKSYKPVAPVLMFVAPVVVWWGFVMKYLIMWIIY